MPTIKKAYETESFLESYLLSHFGSTEEQMPYAFGPSLGTHFPERCVACLRIKQISKAAAALDLGCAVGRSSFELARYCERVIAIDSSEQFILSAKKLQEHGKLSYEYPIEGNLKQSAYAVVPAEIDRSRVTFIQGDVMGFYESQYDKFFDVVIAANLICRLADPADFCKQLPDYLKSGGQLLITSPYSWSEDYTLLSKWLGGTTLQGKSIFSSEVLNEILQPTCELLASSDLPFILRHHQRNFQWGVSHATLWLKR